MDALTLALVIASTLRLTRLIVMDSLPPLPAFRRWVARRVDPETSALWVLLTCPWCMSFWVGLAVLLSAFLYADSWPWRLTAGALSLSLVAGTYEALMARIEE